MTNSDSAVTPATPKSVDDLIALVGETLGPTDWHEVTQERIDDFASATEDLQWIHVDTERAKDSPSGTTIAHGLYTLSLGPKFTEELFSFDGFHRALNYGFDRVRFPASVPSGSRVRMRSTITDVSTVAGGAQTQMEQVFECDGIAKPVCVALSLARFYEREEN